MCIRDRVHCVLQVSSVGNLVTEAVGVTCIVIALFSTHADSDDDESFGGSAVASANSALATRRNLGLLGSQSHANLGLLGSQSHRNLGLLGSLVGGGQTSSGLDDGKK